MPSSLWETERDHEECQDVCSLCIYASCGRRELFSCKAEISVCTRNSRILCLQLALTKQKTICRRRKKKKKKKNPW